MPDQFSVLRGVAERAQAAHGVIEFSGRPDLHPAHVAALVEDMDAFKETFDPVMVRALLHVAEAAQDWRETSSQANPSYASHIYRDRLDRALSVLVGLLDKETR